MNKIAASKSKRMLIPQPKPVSLGDLRPWFRTRRICFTMADWRIVGDALRLACPYARYYRRGRVGEYNNAELPAFTLHEHICDVAIVPNELPEEVMVEFDPDWNWSSSRMKAFLDGR